MLPELQCAILIENLVRPAIILPHEQHVKGHELILSQPPAKIEGRTCSAPKFRVKRSDPGDRAWAVGDLTVYDASHAHRQYTPVSDGLPVSKG